MVRRTYNKDLQKSVTKPDAKITTARNFTRKDFFELCERMKSVYGDRLTRTKKEVARTMTEHLGVQVSIGAIGEAMEATGIAPAFKTGTSRRNQSSKSVCALARIVANLAGNLEKQLGQSFLDDDFKALLAAVRRSGKLSDPSFNEGGTGEWSDEG